MRTSLADRWEAKLAHVRQAFLASLPLESDGSASPDVLARRAVICALLPARLSYFTSARGRVIRLDLVGTFSFRRPTLTNDAEAFLAEAEGDGVVSMTTPGGDALWLALDPHGDPLSPFPFDLDHSLDLRLESELERRRIILAEALDAVGWRLVSVPTPDGTPDPRIGAVARMKRRGGPHPITVFDLAHDMEALPTLVVVPEEVEAIVQITRLLYVHGWHQWEFFSLAQREAAYALEAAVRRLDEEELGRRSDRPLATLLNEVGRSHVPALLSEWERKTGHELRTMRNARTHPTGGQTVAWISWARRDIERSVRLINLMWARRRAHVPVELAWEGDHSIPRPSPHQSDG